MNVLFWGILFLLFVAGMLIVAYGLQRVRGDMHSGNPDSTLQAEGYKNAGRDESLTAMHTGDPKLLYKAPQPKTLYDLYVNRVAQDFVLNQYDKLANTWFHYRGRIGTSVSSDEISALDNERSKSRMHADIAEEDFRKSRANREREKLLGTESAEDLEKNKQGRIQQKIEKWEELKAFMRKHGICEDDPEWEMNQNRYEDSMRKLLEERTHEGS